MVSHGHGRFLPSLISKLVDVHCISQIVVTINRPEPLLFLSHPKLIIIENSTALGFGVNHNKAFERCQSEYFCVLNPDVGFEKEPFSLMIQTLSSDKEIGVVAPVVKSVDGQLEDNLRKFPNIFSISLKVFGLDLTLIPDSDSAVFRAVPWCAGVCMLFHSLNFKRVGGFDPGYYLYYEDVDICARLRMLGKAVGVEPKAIIFHDAQRDSHRNATFLGMHLRSMLRYMTRYKLGLEHELLEANADV